MENEIELVVGTYEDYLVGYRYEQLSLDQTFAVRCHSGSVKALACSPNGYHVLSAGHDDMMNMLNMKKRRLACTLEGSVNCATFVGNNHVVCGSEDGNIYIYECKRDVALRKTLKGHKGPVVALDSHPSGKILSSLSKDGTMRTWNLVKARCAYVNRIKQDANLVKWSKTGEKFLILTSNEVHLYDNTGSKRNSVKLDKRIIDSDFTTRNSLVVATDSGRLDFFDANLDHLFKFQAHDARIKSVVCLREESGSSPDGFKLATASSDGKIKLWLYRSKADKLTLLAETDTGARLTCMSWRIFSTTEQMSSVNKAT